MPIHGSLGCRLIEDKQPDIWHAYGTFCLRSGLISKAEESFRQALALDGSHFASLMALSAVLGHNGKYTDTMYLQDAVSVRLWALPALVLHKSASAPDGLLLQMCMHER